MTMFDERERAFENQFAHEEELRFLTLARRNQLFGRWSAEQIGLRGTDLVVYVRSFVRDAVEARPDAALVEKVRQDFVAHGVEVADRRLHEAMDIAAAEAAHQVRSGIRETGPLSAGA